MSIHGGTATKTAILSTLAHFPGFRMAHAGEFTRRALINGKMDVVQVEGVGRVVEAETELDLTAGLSALEGNNSRIYAEMRDQMI